jgi:hypothetical protein
LSACASVVSSAFFVGGVFSLGVTIVAPFDSAQFVRR